ncbi:NHLP leader peptide domain protein [Kordia sp. SMS9]|uniref:NHLP leader peptide family RiPP precursor n=1 Tax=Kordia sp. SMS9 TaxID=2282170 RepID=UPI000E0D1A73|nr:NHLP leader peptide family RiPP precursor [Kordia sp. SMS9]AXG69010.1 NHLP leader peptide domain protein [Kordia sp. SMS9]
METSQKQERTQQLLAKALEEALTNETFKQELMTNPLEAIENLTGEKLSLKEGTKMQVVDQTEDNVFYLNIPKLPNPEDLELTDEQLELVAGGGWLGAAIGGAVGAIGGPGGVLIGAMAGHAIEEAFS